MEFAGVDKAARQKNGGVENTGVDISARYGKGGQCRSGQFGTMLQGCTLQEWTNQHDVARVDIAGVDNAAPCGRGGQRRSGRIGTVWTGWTMREKNRIQVSLT